METKENKQMAQTEDQARVLEWREQAQKMVAYPEDFGLRRSQVAGLAAKLAGEHKVLVSRPSESSERRVCVLA